VAGTASSENLSVAISCVPAAAAEGVNFTVTMQLACALTVLAVEHVEAAIVKSAAPEMDGLAVKVSGPLPLFVSVTL
jgi:hypothetical protein